MQIKPSIWENKALRVGRLFYKMVRSGADGKQKFCIAAAQTSLFSFASLLNKRERHRGKTTLPRRVSCEASSAWQQKMAGLPQHGKAGHFSAVVIFNKYGYRLH